LAPAAILVTEFTPVTLAGSTVLSVALGIMPQHQTSPATTLQTKSEPAARSLTCCSEDTGTGWFWLGNICELPSNELSPQHETLLLDRREQTVTLQLKDGRFSLGVVATT
jgi:hypothetical protein